jgi:hypothetical protein
MLWFLSYIIHTVYIRYTLSSLLPASGRLPASGIELCSLMIAVAAGVKKDTIQIISFV